MVGMRQAMKAAVHRIGYSVTGLGKDVRLVAPRDSAVRTRRFGEDAWLVSPGGGRNAPRTSPVGEDALLVSHAGRGPRIEALDGRTWVLQARGRARRSVIRMGPKRLRTHLLVDKAAARRNMLMHQRSISNYLATEQIAWILRDLRINCVFDVGANVGQFATMIREAGYRGRIVSFEPLPHLAARLREAAAGDPDWLVYQCGLGEEPGSAEMTVVGGGGSTSSLLPASEFGKEWSPRLVGESRQQVEIRTIEDVYDEAVAGIESPRPYLKMDTQGFDLPAFRGAGKRVDEFLGMQSELAVVPLYEGMARMPEQLAAYEGAGFDIAGMFPVSRDRSSMRVIEFDVLMVRADATAPEAPR